MGERQTLPDPQAAGVLYYVDYECNNYMPEWDFENWGIQYWSKTPAFLQYAAEHP